MEWALGHVNAGQFVVKSTEQMPHCSSHPGGVSEVSWVVWERTLGRQLPSRYLQTSVCWDHEEARCMLDGDKCSEEE